MSSIRSFLLLLFSFSAALGAAAAEPLRLDAIAIARFQQTAPGQWTSKQGLLTVLGQFRETSTTPVPSTVTVPAAALERNLVSYDAWLAYRKLSSVATDNFVADPESVHYRIGERDYLDIAPSPEPRISHGSLLNLSARGYVAPGKPMIGGFVIDAQHRWVLVRAVGPTLATQGVASPLPDPFLTIYHGATGLNYNDDWGASFDAAEIARVSAQVGAFPLPMGAKDAAILVELPPGIYTAHVVTETETSGDVLLEIYSVPE
ncbi:hypothetical protein [Opitutus terrae]|uniref:Uncharacterized protein n=1 Tax=Opitutus terrae (strain DSM 11246 / JCM 15787 / PB90-1) TaxID=452637 RepID=B1ZVJ2_OPITP|nr:hypothetical protein [Opitutus terrae]ACB74089.1 hypothetical protein Oter_0801 [Opitutus terrae PB90-1]